ncbi:MAG: nucleotidyltransferase [bacterium]|nr:nucleotidyltransferase [bacterium]MDT8396081.1 nucleotidyltransferase [bacterium]
MINRLVVVFESLEKHNVRYLVIGGIAAVLYGVPRATFDLDILIDPTEKNVSNLLAALLDAGLATAGDISVNELLEHEITVFSDRVRIDVQTRTPGIEFADSWGRRNTLAYQGQSFEVVSREDLVLAKKAAGREVDLEDVRILELPDEE